MMKGLFITSDVEVLFITIDVEALLITRTEQASSLNRIYLRILDYAFKNPGLCI